jgi:hypothetical protein
MTFEDMTLDSLDKSIDLLVNSAEKEKHVHSRSKEIFDAVAGLWFLGNDFETALACIGHKYIISSFLLKSLELIYDRIRADYDLPEFHAIDLTDSDARKSFQDALQKLNSDSRFVEWLQNDLFSVCKRLLDSTYTHNLDTISMLGNLSDSIQRATERHSTQEDGEIWVYDSIFQFADEVLELHRGMASEHSWNFILPADPVTIDAELGIYNQHPEKEIATTGTNVELQSVA